MKDVFLSESTDYSSVQKSFNGAASVLSLHLCDSVMLFFYFFPLCEA